MKTKEELLQEISCLQSVIKDYAKEKGKIEEEYLSKFKEFDKDEVIECTPFGTHPRQQGKILGCYFFRGEILYRVFIKTDYYSSVHFHSLEARHIFKLHQQNKVEIE
jgi:hypothetical protein